MTRAWLRTFPMSAPPSAIREPGDEPVASFVAWLWDALAAGAAEPHVGVLSTEGPDARALLLRAVDADGWWFSGTALSPKGRQLDANPVAALTFYWPALGRQVRVRGVVVVGDAAVTARDFLDRSVTARAVADASRESQVLADPAEYERAVAQSPVHTDPDYVPDHWRAWCLQPDEVEFWQADPGRRHLRWRYTRGESGWDRAVLWP